MIINPYEVVATLEKVVAEYTGARYAIAVNSCTNALLLCLDFWRASGQTVNIPRRTYVGVAQAILNAGGKVSFRDESWQGVYKLQPFPIWDAARRFTSNMYLDYLGLMCVSFQAAKILGDTQGGAILCNSFDDAEHLKRMRFDGRSMGVAPKDDKFVRGRHCYLSPDVAARLLLHFYSLPDHNEDLEVDDYGDLSLQEIFQ